MIGKRYAFFLVLLTSSCKVAEKNVVGYYLQSDSAGQQRLQISNNHTFVYINYRSPGSFLLDSAMFETKGTWFLKKNKLVVNTFDKSYSDTNRISNIVKTKTNSKKSNLSFQDPFGNMIAFDRISDKITDDDDIDVIFDAAYTDYDIDLAKHKTLFFYLTMYGETRYAPVEFLIKDTEPANYKITVEPYYRQGYFTNKVLLVRKKKLVDGNFTYLRANPIIKTTSDFYIHGPILR